jgi:hypothetical protein
LQLELDWKCGAGWHPARRLATAAAGVARDSKADWGALWARPQVDNLPHKFKSSPTKLQKQYEVAKAAQAAKNWTVTQGCKRTGQWCKLQREWIVVHGEVS